MRFLTDMADQAVVLPLVLAIGIALAAQGWLRGAVAWGLTVIGTFASVLALKLVFLACPGSLWASDLRTPSGHVAAAAVVAGGIAGLLLLRRRTAFVVALLAASVISTTRLALGVHSAAEVVIGAGVGLAGAWSLIMLAGTPPETVDARRIAVIAAGVVVIFHGLHLPAEAHIRLGAWHLAQSLGVCQAAGTRL